MHKDPTYSSAPTEHPVPGPVFTDEGRLDEITQTSRTTKPGDTRERSATDPREPLYPKVNKLDADVKLLAVGGGVVVGWLLALTAFDAGVFVYLLFS